MLELRRFSSKVVFVVTSLIFFTCYYFLALDFNSEIIINVFPYICVAFISSLLIYVYYMLSIRINSKAFRISLSIFLILLFLLLFMIVFTDLSQIEKLWVINQEQIKEMLNI